MLALWIRARLQLCWKRFLSHAPACRALDGCWVPGRKGHLGDECRKLAMFLPLGFGRYALGCEKPCAR